ncbi:helix-turn-helix domain-containing protein [soil metagenome]
MPARHPLLASLQPVADALGATIVGRTRLRSDDIPLEWEGQVVGGFRLPEQGPGLPQLIAGVESEMGGPLIAMNREQKQMAVAKLNERGAFRYRKAVEDIADALGVSRFTVYNYLNAQG